MTDDCTRFREAMSAFSDGEKSPITADEVQSHLDRCPDCQAWSYRLAATNRRLRVGPVIETPDLSGRILASIPATRTNRWLRIALAATGAVQLALGLGQLLVDGFGQGSHGAIAVYWAQHLFDEGAAWNIALGVAFLWAAKRQERANGLFAPLAIFAAIVAGLSVIDLMAGTVPVMRVVTHIPMFVGVILLGMVELRRRSPGPPMLGEQLTEGTSMQGTSSLDSSVEPQESSGLG